MKKSVHRKRYALVRVLSNILQLTFNKYSLNFLYSISRSALIFLSGKLFLIRLFPCRVSLRASCVAGHGSSRVIALLPVLVFQRPGRCGFVTNNRAQAKNDDCTDVPNLIGVTYKCFIFQSCLKFISITMFSFLLQPSLRGNNYQEPATDILRLSLWNRRRSFYVNHTL